MREYFSRLVTSISILVNVLLGGEQYQTLSARQYDLKRRGEPNVASIIDTVFFLESDHCEESWIKWIIVVQSLKKYKNLGVVEKSD